MVPTSFDTLCAGGETLKTLKLKAGWHRKKATFPRGESIHSYESCSKGPCLLFKFVWPLEVVQIVSERWKAGQDYLLFAKG